VIIYDIPGPDGNIRMEIAEEEAIRQMKEIAALKGKVYPNDYEALLDFMVIHWAVQK
jgi:hypothetical protein